MSNGEIRRSQAIGTFGPGALIDLPDESAIMGGLNGWPAPKSEDQIHEPRLSTKVGLIAGVNQPRLYAPPADDSMPWEMGPGVTAWRFPNWFVVQERGGNAEEARTGDSLRSRRLVHRSTLYRGKYEGVPVVATRFVQACRRGHVGDFRWREFVHGGASDCGRQLWLDEQGTGGDLSDLTVRCECKQSRSLVQAMLQETPSPLGFCRGERPWLGRNAHQNCDQQARLLIRTASNAYFPILVTVLSLPEDRRPVDVAVGSCWEQVQNVLDVTQLKMLRDLVPNVQTHLAPFQGEEILEAIQRARGGGDEQRSVKEAELEAILSSPVGYGDDVPINDDFHARHLPGSSWRKTGLCDPIESVVQLHRLREVTSNIGFTRFEPMTPDIHGEYDEDLEPASIDLEPRWFPAVENRGEGIFVQLKSSAVKDWTREPAVKARINDLVKGHDRFQERRAPGKGKDFVGAPYVLLHTLSHLVMQSLSMSCGYPASSLKERIYVEGDAYGFLLYTGSPDADGTLGGLVQEARHFEHHLANALRAAALCSNDPICSQHDSGKSLEGRWLHGAACHGCSLTAETSCEMRNDYLDRALVVPVLGLRDAAFFPELG